MAYRSGSHDDSGPGVDYSSAPARGQPGFVDWWIQNTGQLFTPDPLRPDTYYQSDPNVSGGLQRVDSRGNPLATYGPAGPLSQGGAGFDLTQVDPETGGPGRIQYPTEVGGFLGLGDIGGSLAAVAMLAALAGSAGTLAGPVAAGTAGTAGTIGAGATLGSGALTVASQAAQNADLQKAALALGLVGAGAGAVSGLTGSAGALQGPTLSGATLDTVGTGSGSLASGAQAAAPYAKAGGAGLKILGAATGNEALSQAGGAASLVGGGADAAAGAGSDGGALGTGLSWGDLATLGITGAGAGALAASLAHGGGGSATGTPSPGSTPGTGGTPDMAATPTMIGQPGTQPTLDAEQILAQLRALGVEGMPGRAGLQGAALDEARRAANASPQQLLTGLRGQITQLRQGLQAQFSQASRALGPAGSKLVAGEQGKALASAGGKLSDLFTQAGSAGQSGLLSFLQGQKPSLLAKVPEPVTSISTGAPDFTSLASALKGGSQLYNALKSPDLSSLTT